MRTTINGFVARPNGELDWMTKDWDDELVNCILEINDSCDTIFMGRKMTDEFIEYWTDVVKNPESREYPFARQMVDYPKVVFTNTLDESRWANTTLAKGDIAREVNNLKNQSGKDIIVYGGGFCFVFNQGKFN